MNRFAGGPLKIISRKIRTTILDSAPQSTVTVRRIFSGGPETEKQAFSRLFGGGPFPVPLLAWHCGEVLMDAAPLSKRFNFSI
jgi:hypothetical protein